MSKYQKFSHRKTGGGVSVEEYGAAGDGMRNETQNLQLALDQEQHVHIPAGTYRVNGTLTANLDKQTITGAGKATVIKMMGNKTYDLTQQHAALTMNAGDQTVQDLQLVGPDTGDDSTFTGSGSDWYNLSGLRADGPALTVQNVQVDRCEGIGVHVSAQHCEVSLCWIERTGLHGLRMDSIDQSVFGSRFLHCAKATYSNITTYPSDTTFAVNLREKDCVVSGCYFAGNTRDITCREYHQIISNNMCRSGVHVKAQYVVVNNNVLRSNGSVNAITVANDGNSYISSLTGNDIVPMDQGGADDIIKPWSFSEYPIKNATANVNPDINRIYQQKAHATIRPNDAGNNGDGSVPFGNIDRQQLINVNVSKDRFTVERNMLIQITMPPVVVNTNFYIGEFHVYDEDNSSTVSMVWTATYNNSSNGNVFVGSSTLQARLQPNTTYKLYMHSDHSQTVADLGYDENWLITIIDLE